MNEVFTKYGAGKICSVYLTDNGVIHLKIYYPEMDFFINHKVLKLEDIKWMQLE